jgi:hypothetical protein
MSGHHLAQLNIGLPIEPVDSQRLAGFMAQLEPINALADAAPGFVWRLQTEDGDATAIRPFEDDRLIVNMSVWRSVEDLADFVYRTAHAAVMRQRRQWFVPMREAYTVLWWVPAGHRPSLEDATARLEMLRTSGPSAAAFTLQRPFPRPGSDVAPAVADDWFCPA